MGPKIYVGRLPHSVTDKQLKDLFAAHGAVAGARVITDKFTGQSRGFGFVEMASDAEAQAAMQALNRSEMGGSLLTQNESVSEVLKEDVDVAIKEGIRRVDEVSVNEEKEQLQPQPEQRIQPHGQETTWQQREKRRVGIDRHAKVQMEVLMRPEVRPDIIALGVAHGMAGQKYIEHLIVNAVNESPELVTKGEQYIKRAKGNIRRAIAIAREDMNLSSDDSEITLPTSRSL